MSSESTAPGRSDEVEIEVRAVRRGEHEATDEEIAGFLALVSEPQQRQWDPGGEQLDMESLTVFLRRETPRRIGQAVFLAKAGSRVVGMSAVFTGLDGPAKLGFGVSAGWQRLGIGRLLLMHALAHAREAGLPSLVAEVLPHNLRAIAALAGAGFAPTDSFDGPRAGLMQYEIEP